MEQKGASLVNDLIELRLPLKPEYLPVLRATMGVIAGAAAFSYEDIMCLRVAVSEVFDRAIENFRRGERASEVHELAVRFGVQPGKIEVLMACPTGATGPLDREEAKESQALVRSLVDEVAFDVEADGKAVVRMVKYQSRERTQ
jgi:anti-sigma regulatory factor (Ser/Thr protein kinase)